MHGSHSLEWKKKLDNVNIYQTSCIVYLQVGYVVDLRQTLSGGEKNQPTKSLKKNESAKTAKLPASQCHITGLHHCVDRPNDDLTQATGGKDCSPFEQHRMYARPQELCFARGNFAQI